MGSVHPDPSPSVAIPLAEHRTAWASGSRTGSADAGRDKIDDGRKDA